MNKSKYPKDWKQISFDVRFVRAGGRCEQCGVVHGAIGARDKVGDWHSEDFIHAMNSDEGTRLFGDNFNWKMTTICLTTHHIGIDKPDGTKGSTHDKMDCRPENLIALCQKCHLAADMETHIANRKKTYAKRRTDKLDAIGQRRLFDSE